MKSLFSYSILLQPKFQPALLTKSSHAVYFLRGCSVAPGPLEGIRPSFTAFCGTYRKLWMGEGCLQELKRKATALRLHPSEKLLGDLAGQGLVQLLLLLLLKGESMQRWSPDGCGLSVVPVQQLRRDVTLPTASLSLVAILLLTRSTVVALCSEYAWHSAKRRKGQGSILNTHRATASLFSCYWGNLTQDVSSASTGNGQEARLGWLPTLPIWKNPPRQSTNILLKKMSTTAPEK